MPKKTNFLSVKVKKIIMNGESDLAQAWGGWEAIGTIFFTIVGSSNDLNYDSTRIEDRNINSYDGVAKPYFPQISYIPLENEIVNVFRLPSWKVTFDKTKKIHYYFPPINIWSHPHHNTVPTPEQYVDEGESISPADDYKQNFSRRNIPKDIEIPLGDYFAEKTDIKPLLPYEGDHILQGRFGNSIRFGSTSRGIDIPENQKNPWSNGAKGNIGDPITIIRNGQSIGADSEGWIPGIENIHFDPASIYLTSNQKLDELIPASTNWFTFGNNATITQNPQVEVKKIFADPVTYITEDEIDITIVEEAEEVEENISTQEEIAAGAANEAEKEIESGIDSTTATTENLDNETIETDQTISGSAGIEVIEDTNPTATPEISEDETILTEEEAFGSTDQNRYYEDGEGDQNIVDPKLPENYKLGSENQCQGCKYFVQGTHINQNNCSFWEATVRSNFVCASWEPKAEQTTDSSGLNIPIPGPWTLRIYDPINEEEKRCKVTITVVEDSTPNVDAWEVRTNISYPPYPFHEGDMHPYYVNYFPKMVTFNDEVLNNLIIQTEDEMEYQYDELDTNMVGRLEIGEPWPAASNIQPDTQTNSSTNDSISTGTNIDIDASSYTNPDGSINWESKYEAENQIHPPSGNNDKLRTDGDIILYYMEHTTNSDGSIDTTVTNNCGLPTFYLNKEGWQVEALGGLMWVEQEYYQQALNHGFEKDGITYPKGNPASGGPPSFEDFMKNNVQFGVPGAADYAVSIGIDISNIDVIDWGGNNPYQ